MALDDETSEVIEFNQTPFDESKNYPPEDIYNQVDKTCKDLTTKHFPKQKYRGFRSCSCMQVSGLTGKEANEKYVIMVEIYLRCAEETDKLAAKFSGLEKKAE